MPTTKILLFNISLAVFAFLITNARITVVGVSGWLHVSVFAFFYIKIII